MLHNNGHNAVPVKGYAYRTMTNADRSLYSIAPKKRENARACNEVQAELSINFNQSHRIEGGEHKKSESSECTSGQRLRRTSMPMMPAVQQEHATPPSDSRRPSLSGLCITTHQQTSDESHSSLPSMRFNSLLERHHQQSKAQQDRKHRSHSRVNYEDSSSSLLSTGDQPFDGSHSSLSSIFFTSLERDQRHARAQDGDRKHRSQSHNNNESSSSRLSMGSSSRCGRLGDRSLDNTEIERRRPPAHRRASMSNTPVGISPQQTMLGNNSSGSERMRRPIQRRATMSNTPTKPSPFSPPSIGASSQKNTMGNDLSESERMRRPIQRRMSNTPTIPSPPPSASIGASSQQNTVGNNSSSSMPATPSLPSSASSGGSSQQNTMHNSSENERMRRPVRRRATMSNTPTKPSHPSSASIGALSHQNKGDNNLSFNMPTKPSSVSIEVSPRRHIEDNNLSESSRMRRPAQLRASTSTKPSHPSPTSIGASSYLITVGNNSSKGEGMRRLVQRRSSTSNTPTHASPPSSISIGAPSKQSRVGENSSESERMRRPVQRRSSTSNTSTHTSLPCSISIGTSSKQNRVGENSSETERMRRPVQRRASVCSTPTFQSNHHALSNVHSPVPDGYSLFSSQCLPRRQEDQQRAEAQRKIQQRRFTMSSNHNGSTPGAEFPRHAKPQPPTSHGPSMSHSHFTTSTSQQVGGIFRTVGEQTSKNGSLDQRKASSNGRSPLPETPSQSIDSEAYATKARRPVQRRSTQMTSSFMQDPQKTSSDFSQSLRCPDYTSHKSCSSNIDDSNYSSLQRRSVLSSETIKALLISEQP